MSSEPTSGMSRIMEVGLANEGQDQDIDGSHDPASIRNGQTSSIFLKNDVAVIMETGFTAPMRFANVQ